MNIGIDIRLYGTVHGGIGRYCKELIPRLLKLDKQNKYFLFYNKSLAFEDFSELQKFNNTELIEANYRHYSFGEQIYFLKLLNKYNLDLVHFPNFNVPYFYKKPFVVTIHDMVHHKIGGAKKSHWVHFWAYKKIIAQAGKNAKRIITVSEYSQKDIINFLQLPQEKITVVYEGKSLSNEVSQGEIEIVKKRYFIDKPYFLFVGVLERKKNVVNLTRGFDYFLQKYKVKVDLVIVGKADKHYPEIKHQALDIKNNNNLVFTGYVNDQELSALYKGAYAFTSASLHEGFGLPGVEALGFSLPLLVSNIEVFNEIYDNTALYFDPLDPKDIGEKMNILFRDEQFHEQIQKKSRERGFLFDWKNTAKETLEIYKQAVFTNY